MVYDENNIFAKIIRSEIPCDRVYEDDHVLAFKDIHPKANVHVLVLPKKGYISIDDFGEKATPEETKAFFKAVSKIARDLGVEEMGYRVIANHKPYSGQEVYHFHVHILGGEPLGPLVSLPRLG
jgi:histidine triad (HIT) family protein